MGTGVVTFAFAISSSSLDLKAKSGPSYVPMLIDHIEEAKGWFGK